MAKLKKTLKQEQKRSSKHKVTKLSPAEIRSLNHGAGFAEPAWQSVRNGEHRSLQGLISSTPPLSPDARSLSRNSTQQSHQERRSHSTPPTPPQSPARDRRGSNASSRHVIHAPKPMTGSQISHLTNSNYPSRTPSASSYRGVATYRGPEVTRTGSLTMFAHPSPQIVANPLSQFSRPRQSTLTSQGPLKSNSETFLNDENTSPVYRSERHKSLGATSADPSREQSPVRRSDSPVSMEEGKVPSKADVALTQPKSDLAEDAPRASTLDTASDLGETTEPSAKQKLKWRKTFSGTFDSHQDPIPLRKEQRKRTFIKQSQCLHALHYDDTKPGPQPLMRDTLRDELPSVRTSVFKDDDQKLAASEYGQHPAVRPFSTDTERNAITTSDSSPSSNKKGKERETDTETDSDQHSLASSVPSYSRCSCCGRVQKNGFETELSPVMENENIRTNFDFEVIRTSGEGRRRLSMSNSHRYTPIIPMEVGNETKQARIEPFQETTARTGTPVLTEPKPRIMGIVNKAGDVIGPSSIPLAIMPKTKTDPRLSRFGSLHARREDLKEEEEKQNLEPDASIPAPPQLQRFGSLYGVRNDALPQNLPQAAPALTAYQAQQAKHYSMPNVHRPIRSSRLAYQEAADQTPAVNQPEQYGPRLASSPTMDSKTDTKPSTDVVFADRSRNSDADEDFAVDLSSFDGSFVHRSLSRAATVPHDISPPTSEHARNGYQFPPTNGAVDSYYNAATTSAQIADDKQLDQTVQNGENNIGVALSTPSHSSETLAVARDDWLLPSSDLTDTMNSSAPAVQKPSTIVKIIPSNPISPSSSLKSANGQLKLGDWILPESPKAASPTQNTNGVDSVSTVALGKRPVAAA